MGQKPAGPPGQLPCRAAQGRGDDGKALDFRLDSAGIGRRAAPSIGGPPSPLSKREAAAGSRSRSGIKRKRQRDCLAGAGWERGAVLGTPPGTGAPHVMKLRPVGVKKILFQRAPKRAHRDAQRQSLARSGRHSLPSIVVSSAAFLMLVGRLSAGVQSILEGALLNIRHVRVSNARYIRPHSL